MLKRRLIPILYLKDGWMVRSQDFRQHNYIGDPVAHIDRMMEWNVDELIILDIGEEESVFDHHRSDYRTPPAMTMLDFIERSGAQCNLPLTFGGRIRSYDDIAIRIASGADKVSVNTMLHEAPDLVTAAARAFGSQAIVASIDYRIENGSSVVYTARGRRRTAFLAPSMARRAAEIGAGEILLNAMDRDGAASGYDLETIALAADAVDLPVIACGGGGTNEHFAQLFEKTPVSAAAAGNIFHFKENAYPMAKAHLKARRADIR
jgi:imidazole glycerol-phosphate synthase subunit HisF